VGGVTAAHTVADLAGVGYHYSTLEALDGFLDRDQVAVGFVGRPFDRVRLLPDGQAAAVNVWGAPAYLLEQQGYRKIVDTTFLMGWLRERGLVDVDPATYDRTVLAWRGGGGCAAWDSTLAKLRILGRAAAPAGG
jgi:hypothetical protein